MSCRMESSGRQAKEAERLLKESGVGVRKVKTPRPKDTIVARYPAKQTKPEP
jgi:beta-lactam-binding protein with PASTA domain